MHKKVLTQNSAKTCQNEMATMIPSFLKWETCYYENRNPKNVIQEPKYFKMGFGLLNKNV